MEPSYLILMLLAAGQNITVQYQPPPQPTPPVHRSEARKEARDKVLREVGQQAAGWCRHFGDPGVNALLQCKPETAKSLVDLFESGETARWNTKIALEVIRKHGEPVAAWMVANHTLFAGDKEAMEVFAADPLEFVYDLKDLSKEAADKRAARMPSLPWGDGKAAEWLGNWKNLALGAGALVIVLLLVQVRRQRKQQAIPPVP